LVSLILRNFGTLVLTVVKQVEKTKRRHLFWVCFWGSEWFTVL